MSGALGRLVEHDPRSRAFAAARAPQPVTVLWERQTRPYDQGELGCCTGAAMAGLLMTLPYWVPGRRLKLHNAQALYSRATQLDGFAGSWPADDTGSSGLAVARAAREAGWIAGYGHAFGLDHALAALVYGPVLTGISWYDSMDRPTSAGLVRITKNAELRGGHEVVVVGCDVEKREVRACNSWGPEWGDHGYFRMSWDTWARLLAEDGDVTTVVAR